MRRWNLAIIVAATLAALALVSCGDDDGGRPGALLDVANGEGGGTTSERAAPSTDDYDTSGGSGAGANSLLDRKIIFTTNLDLATEDVRSTYQRANQVARRAGGFIESSSLSTRDGDGGESRDYATITMRVPIEQYTSVLDELRALPGTNVAHEESTSTEVTEEYTDLQSRVRNLERSEAQYLELLAKAETIEDILLVNDRIDQTRAQIEQVQGRINLLDDLTDLATVSLSIAPVAAMVEPGSGGGIPTFAEAMEWAFDRSLEVLKVAAAGAAILVVAAMWLTLPLGLVLAGSRVMRRRHAAPSA